MVNGSERLAGSMWPTPSTRPPLTPTLSPFAHATGRGGRLPPSWCPARPLMPSPRLRGVVRGGHRGCRCLDCRGGATAGGPTRQMPRITDMGKVGEVAVAALAPLPRDSRTPLPSLAPRRPVKRALEASSRGAWPEVTRREGRGRPGLAGVRTRGPWLEGIAWRCRLTTRRQVWSPPLLRWAARPSIIGASSETGWACRPRTTAARPAPAPGTPTA
jgi:hypothetical protein